jgi:hypothetical protein
MIGHSIRCWKTLECFGCEDCGTRYYDALVLGFMGSVRVLAVGSEFSHSGWGNMSDLSEIKKGATVNATLLISDCQTQRV